MENVPEGLFTQTWGVASFLHSRLGVYVNYGSSTVASKYVDDEKASTSRDAFHPAGLYEVLEVGNIKVTMIVPFCVFASRV